MVAFAEIKETAGQLYDVETRPKLVMDALVYLNAEKILGKVGLVNGSAEKVVRAVADMTTVGGLIEKKNELVEIAAPYVEKAKDAEGRKELKEQLASMYDEKVAPIVDEKVVEPVKAKYAAGQAFVAPYVTAVKESATVVTTAKKIEEIRKSERVEKMIAAFQAAREHPAEKIGEMRAKAVDLIKYDNIKSYRDYIMSEEFQSDTIKLVKVTLPTIAMDAAKNGKASVEKAAIDLATKVDEYKTSAIAFVTSTKDTAYGKIPTKEEVEAMRLKLKESALLLLSELSVELKGGYKTIKDDGFKLAEVKKTVFSVVGVVDKIVVSPTTTYLKETFEAKAAAPATEAVTAEAEKPAAVAKEVERPLPPATNGAAKKAKPAPPPPKPAVEDDE